MIVLNVTSIRCCSKAVKQHTTPSTWYLPNVIEEYSYLEFESIPSILYLGSRLEIALQVRWAIQLLPQNINEFNVNR